jgi:integrase
MASVTKRTLKSGVVTWRVQFRVDGGMRQETFSDPVAATEFGKLVDDVGGTAAREVRDARSSLGGKTLAEYTALYVDRSSGMLSGVSDRTYEDYRKMANRSFLKILGPQPMIAIGKTQVRKWVVWQEAQVVARTGKPIAAKTVRNYQALLSQILEEAVEEGEITRNYAKGVKLRKGKPRPAVFLSKREFAVILRFIPEFYRPLTLFLVGSGARWSEATAVEWRDISTESSPATLSIERAWKKGADGKMRLGPPKTEKSVRSVPLDDVLVEQLGAPGLPTERIFQGKLSANRVWYGRYRDGIFAPAVGAANDSQKCAALGLDPISKFPRIHDLRHTHASWLIKAKISLPVIQDRLGHDSIKTTIDRYGHIEQESRNEAALVGATIMTDVLIAAGLLEPTDV